MPPMSILILLMEAWMACCVHTYANQIVIIVETMSSTDAMVPICLAFISSDLKYVTPGHFVTMIKQINGRTILNA